MSSIWVYLCAAAMLAPAKSDWCQLQLNHSTVFVVENEPLVEPCTNFDLKLSSELELDALQHSTRLITSLDIGGQVRLYEQDLTRLVAMGNQSYQLASSVFWRQFTSSSSFNYEAVQSVSVRLTASVMGDDEDDLLARCNASLVVTVLNVNEYRPEVRAVRVNGTRVGRKDALDLPVNCDAFQWPLTHALVGTVVVLDARDDDLPDTISFLFKMLNVSLLGTARGVASDVLDAIQFTPFGLILVRDAAFCSWVASNGSLVVRVQVTLVDSGTPSLTSLQLLALRVRVRNGRRVPPVIAAQLQTASEWNSTCTILAACLALLAVISVILITLLVRSRQRYRPRHNGHTLHVAPPTPPATELRPVSKKLAKHRAPVSIINGSRNRFNGSPASANAANSPLNGSSPSRILKCSPDSAQTTSDNSPLRTAADPDFICERATWNDIA